MRIRIKLRSGGLPREPGAGETTVPGTRARCDGCDETIETDQLERRVDIGSLRPLRFHLICAAIWNTERQNLV